MEFGNQKQNKTLFLKIRKILVHAFLESTFRNLMRLHAYPDYELFTMKFKQIFRATMNSSSDNRPVWHHRVTLLPVHQTLNAFNWSFDQDFHQLCGHFLVLYNDPDWNQDPNH